MNKPPPVCLGCTSQLSTCDAGVNIFSRETALNLKKDNNNVKRGIELITGLTVSDADGLPGRLCADCNEKIKEFLAFRAQLLTSLRVFLSSGYSSARSDPPSCSAQLLSLAEKDSANDNPVTEINKVVKIENEIGGKKNGYDNKINVNVDEDAESEIDVCSGEDDGVLELDVQCKKDEIWEIESSDESDIQVL